MSKKSSLLPSELQKIVYEIIQRNAYFAHSENIVLCMLADNRAFVRELALRRILKARSFLKGYVQLQNHRFNLPTLDFEAKEYYNSIFGMSLLNLQQQ